MRDLIRDNKKREKLDELGCIFDHDRISLQSERR